MAMFISLVFLFVDIFFSFFTQPKSKWFSLQQFLFETDNSFHKLLPITFMYILLFLFQKHTI